MSLFLLVVLVPLAFVIGIGASAIGVTAWFLMVPVLFVLFGFDLYLTLFISLSIDCGNALIMTVIAGQNQQLDLKQGLRLSLFASAVVILGVYLGTMFIPENKELFKSPSAFATFLFGLGFVRRGSKQGRLEADSHASVKDPVVSVLPVSGGHKWFSRATLLFPGVFSTGLQSGLFGIGGGMMYSIFLMFCRAYPTLKATGTAMLISLISTLIAGTGIFFQIPAAHNIDRQKIILILLLVLFSMIGTISGARIAYSLSLRKLNYLIASVIIFAASLAIIQGLIIGS